LEFYYWERISSETDLVGPFATEVKVPGTCWNFCFQEKKQLRVKKPWCRFIYAVFTWWLLYVWQASDKYI